MKKTYTVKQVADALGFSTNTVYKYLDEKKIKATRLGKEGRFRIPEEEVVRLLGLKGEKPQIAPALNSEHPARSASEPEGEDYNLKLGLLNKISNPDLFDWFLSLTAIFLGISYFLFPLNYQYISFEPYRLYLLVLKISLVVLGVALMATDVFLPVKKTHNHLLIRLPLAFVLASLTFIFYKTFENWTASYFGVLAVFATLPIFLPKASFLKFISFVYFLVVVSGWIWALNPEAFFFADIRDFVHASPVLFQILLTTGATILTAIAVFAYFRFQPLLLPLSWFISGLFFLISISFINDQFWNKAVVALMIGSFGLILPFYKEFDTLSKFSRRDVLISFSWLVLVLLVGVAVVFYTQTTFRQFVSQESQKRVETAAKLVESNVLDSIKYTNAIASDPALLDLLSAKKVDREKLEEFVKAKYQGATTLRRVTIVNAKGDVSALYPIGNIGAGTVNIVDLEHFQQSTKQKKTVVSKLIESRVVKGTQTIVVAAPIIDAKGNVLGMVGGGIDTAQLMDKLSTVEFGNKGSFALADNKKVIFIDQDENLIGKEAKINSALLRAVSGNVGEMERYSESGKLSLQAYTYIPLTGWGIVLQQPVSEAFRDSSLISFTIFLITIFSGVGALLVTMYLKKRQL